MSASISSIFDDPSAERDFTNIEVLSKGVGWITGMVFMTWPIRNRTVKLQLTSPGKIRLSIEFRNGALLMFNNGDFIKILLEGARVEPRTVASSASGEHLPVTLFFESDVPVMFTKCARQHERLGTIWRSHTLVANDENLPVCMDNDWFSTPNINQEMKVPEIDEDFHLDELQAHIQPTTQPQPPFPVQASVIEESSASHFTQEPVLSCLRTPVEVSLTIPDPESLPPPNSLPTPVTTPTPPPGAIVTKPAVLSRNPQGSDCIQKKKRKRTNEHDAAQKAKKVILENSAPPSQERFKPEPPPPNDTHGSHDLAKPYLSKRTRKKREKQEKLRRQREAEEHPAHPPRNPALDMVAGFSSEVGPFTPLGKLSGVGTVSIVGVALSVGAAVKSRKSGEWFLTVNLVDPSNFDNPSGFKVTCFSKEHSQWLPSPARGEILLLRQVKVSDWNGNLNGVVYNDKLSWAAFKPTDGHVYHSTLPRGVPKTVSSIYGPDYCPFFSPGPKELEYFLKLGEWWRAVEEQRVGSDVVVVDAVPQRQHRLIGDVEPNVFFNATVEVLRAVTMDDGQLGLMITDYTDHPLIIDSPPYGRQALWCLTSKMDSHRDELVAGSLWSMENVRVKIGTTGRLEGDLFASKLFRLNPEDHADGELYQALLKRKEGVRIEQAENLKLQQGFVLIQDAQLGRFCTFTVELLYLDRASDGVTDLYVTDYTKNTNPSTYLPEKLYRVVKGIPVFRIAVWEQHDILKTLELNRYYTIRNVKIMGDSNGGLKGNVNYADEAIVRMRTKNTGSEELLRLLERKEKLSEQPGNLHSISDHVKDGLSINRPAMIRSRHMDQRINMIKEITTCSAIPNKFRLNARIVDFYPRDLVNFTQRRCRNCTKMITERRHACTDCEDMMGEYVDTFYRFFLRLEDQSGDRIDVSVCDDAINFLGGLKPVHLGDHPDELKRLTELLAPFLGNLIEVHKRLEVTDVPPVYGPFLDLAIESWAVKSQKGGEVVAYGLTGCEIVV